jgi:large subunit ribosomal protein L4
METITLPTYNTQGQEVGKIELDAAVFGGPVNKAAIYQEVCAYRANQRRGLASTKTMGEVSGGGRKPWRQKGTGRARVGSIRSPLWRHGGVVFGPHPRDFSYTIPDKIKKVALKSALCLKLAENNLTIMEDFKMEQPKTKEAVKVFANLKIKPLKGLLLLLSESDRNSKLALRNINFLDFVSARNLNTFEVLAHKKLIITKDGLNEIVKRLKK